MATSRKTINFDVAPAAREFFATFTSSTTEGGFSLQAAAPSRATIVQTGRDGPSGVRLQTLPGDSNLFGSGTAERCDLMLPQSLTNGVEGVESWWAHSILFPTDYVDPPQSAEIPNPWYFGNVFNFHNTTSGNWQANFNVQAMPVTATSPDRPTGLNFAGFGGVNSGDGAFTAAVGSVVRNVWFDFVYNMRWSSSSSGFFKAWVNGALKLNHVGPTSTPGRGSTSSSPTITRRTDRLVP